MRRPAPHRVPPASPPERRGGEADARIGRLVRSLRRAGGVTQAELAGRLGVSYQQVQKYESGRDRLSAVRLLDVAEALAADPMDILSGARATPSRAGAEAGRDAGEAPPPQAALTSHQPHRGAEP